jgi:hypothetical protein
MNTSTAQWTKESIQALLLRSDKAIEHALVRLYARQTLDEQASDDTKHRNGRGFTAFDAEILSSFAKQVIRSPRPEGQKLSQKQLAICRRPASNGTGFKLGYYWKQLLEEIEAKQAETKPSFTDADEAEMNRMVREAELAEDARVAEYKYRRDSVAA